MPGTYRVEFTLPAGFVWTTANVGANGSDVLDSDAVPVAADAPTARTAPFALTSTPATDSDPGGLPVTDPTIDAGVVPVLSLGDLVWIDEDGDGVYEPATELPYSGATVTLVDGAGDPVLDALGNPVGPTTTDAAGRYSFTDLLPGDYSVVFTLPPGYAWTPDLQGPDGSLDSDAVAATPVRADRVERGVHPVVRAGRRQRRRRSGADEPHHRRRHRARALARRSRLDRRGSRRPIRPGRRAAGRRCRRAPHRHRRQRGRRRLRQPGCSCDHRRRRSVLLHRPRAGHLPRRVRPPGRLRLDGGEHGWRRASTATPSRRPRRRPRRSRTRSCSRRCRSPIPTRTAST